MPRQKKYSWAMVRRDFKERFPDLSKNSNYWRPYDFMSIEVYLNDGRKIIFDDIKRRYRPNGRWKDGDEEN